MIICAVCLFVVQRIKSMLVVSSSQLFMSLYSAVVETSTSSGTVHRLAADLVVTWHHRGPPAYSIFTAFG